MNAAGDVIRYNMNKFHEFRKLFEVPNGPNSENFIEFRQNKAVIGLIELTVHITCHREHDNKFTWGDFFTHFTKKFSSQFAMVCFPNVIPWTFLYTGGWDINQRGAFEAQCRYSFWVRNGQDLKHWYNSRNCEGKEGETCLLQTPIHLFLQCLCGYHDKNILLYQWHLVNKEMMSQLDLEGWCTTSFVDHMYMFLFEAFRTITKIPVRCINKDNTESSMVSSKSSRIPSQHSRNSISERKKMEFLRAKKLTEKKTDEDFEKYKQCVDKILHASPDVVGLIGKVRRSRVLVRCSWFWFQNSQYLIDITVEAIEESDHDMTWYKIMEQVCYVAIATSRGKQIVARGKAPDSEVQLGIVQSKESLAKVSFSDNKSRPSELLFRYPTQDWSG